MTTLKVNGARDPHPEATELGRGLPQGSVVLKDAVVTNVGRAGGTVLTLDDLQADDVVEIELQDGLRIWSRVQDVARDFAPRARRGLANDAIALPSMLTIGPASRGSGGWAIKALKVLGLDLAGEITDLVATHVEGRLQPGPGLYHCSEADVNELRPLQSPEGKGPTLVLLHGTASSTDGSFAGLWARTPGSPIRELFRQYEGRVLAYQHQTLTRSPIANALDLATTLAASVPPNSELHLVSHSRGGLIGELLARGMRQGAAPFTPDDLALFEEDGWIEDRQALEALSRVLTESRFRITRFVRVACPARGTTLADRRLDRYFTILVNLAALIPTLKANPVYDALTSLLAGVLKKRTDPRELPGLEAMMPTSPLVRMLNRPDVVSSADLHVLGGDIAGVGVFGRLKTLVSDFYYRDDHDLVVNTPAMLGGMERTAPVRYWIDSGDKVTHFHYFARTDTARRLVGALAGAADFRTLEVKPSSITAASYVKRGTLSRPVVVVLPGIMGSQLSVGDRPVWLSILALARGGLSLLRHDAGDVRATGLFSDGYADLCRHLEQTHEVERFPYDWRRTITESAEQLRGTLEDVVPWAERASQPVRLLAHSMGGLVVRAMLADPAGRELWDRACRAHAGSRFIMLGTPNAGSHAIAALLIGRDALVKKLALLDLRSDHSGLLATIAGFDGVLDLLPHGGALDFFDHAVWQRLLELDAPQERGLFGSEVASSKSAGFRWSIPSSQGLAKARRLADAIRASPLDPARTVYVAGVADATACDLVIDQEAPAGRRVKVLASSHGDGRVLWKSGIPPGIPTFYLDTVHGDLASDRRHFAALVELLNTGTSARLPTSPPVSRGPEETFELPEPEPAMVPDEAELVADALGGRRTNAEFRPSLPKVDIRVVNDNLTNARFPVLAGHYRNDVIVAAEEYLDRRLSGRLSELLRLELYAGPIGTAVVVLNEVRERDLSIHPGAVVAGLGLVGDLTPGSLTSTLAQALTLYGAECVGRARRHRQRLDGGSAHGGEISVPITALLVGSGEAGVTLSDSLLALLRAVRQANHRLGEATRSSGDGTESDKLTARIDQVDILELYQDRAIEALHELRSLSQSPEFEAFTVEPTLLSGPEGRRRARFNQAQAWWQRIRVRGDDQGALEFEAVTRSARAAARLLPTQRDLVDGFVRDAIRTTANDPSLGQTLFELLVPTDFKAYAPDRRRLALMLNARAAAIPWELMYDGFDRTVEPISVSGGMIRQLLLPDERQHVLRAPADTALVVGDPIVADERFSPLPGAAAEAGVVDELLRGSGFDVQLLIGKEARPKSVLAALHEKSWRILHLAAHGVFEFSPAAGKAAVTGLVLDDGVFFTAADAEQMRYVPDIVFINCCHLGQTRGDAAPRTAFPHLAANLATQFIRIGARAVVAAGWEVDDAAAKTFATTFYTEMLRGTIFGDAVIRARREVFLRHGETNTWGAYQCYGDVSFSLSTPEKSSVEVSFVSDTELAIALEAIAAKARQEGGDPTGLLRELEPYLSSEPAAWWTSAELCARAGQALEELGQFDRAIEYYTRVLTAEPATAPIHALERLANSRVRRAGQLMEMDPVRASGLLDQAENTLRHLLALGETAERWSLLGGVMKRRFMISEDRPATRREALREMSRAYGKAYELARPASRGDRTYPLSNQLAADIVLSWFKADDKPAMAKILDRLRDLQDQVSAAASSRTDTFNLLAAADHMLLDALARRALDGTSTTAILGRFADAVSRGVTPREQDSIRTQLRFLQAAVLAAWPKSRRSKASRQLKLLEEALPPEPETREQAQGSASTASRG